LSIEARLDRSRVAPGRPLELQITISWPGAADDYIIEPPAPVLPEGVVPVSSAFTSTMSDQNHILSYSYTLKAERRGAFAITPVPIKYWAKDAGEETLASTAELTFEAVTFPWMTVRLIWALVIAAALIISGVLVTAAVTNKRLRPATSRSKARTMPEKDYFSTRLAACRQCKLNGDLAGFYQAAHEIARRLPEAEPALLENLSATLERVRFGGYRPTAEELEARLRQLERRAGALAGDPHDQQQAGLK